jgi:hypothetical protein
VYYLLTIHAYLLLVNDDVLRLTLSAWCTEVNHRLETTHLLLRINSSGGWQLVEWYLTG